MAKYVSVTSDKKKSTALLLCVFLGMFGAHYFYVGRIGRGIVCILTMNWFMFGWFVDIFRIISGKFCDNTGTYLRE